MLPEPTFTLKYPMGPDFLNALTQGLAESGYEGSKGDRVHGERDAMEKHLKDLQKYMDRLLK